jgi:predicted NBD/HSP70 family sugar kinase
MVDIWAGIDAGKREHHCVVIDEDGTQLLSQRIINDEETLLGLIAEVCSLADDGWVT